MKRIRIFQLIIFSICTYVIPITGNTQLLAYTFGPENIDTTKFAHVYFIRDSLDNFPNDWLGVILNDNHGICVKAKSDGIYRVNTLLKGETRFHTSVNNAKTEIFINLQPGQNHYVQLWPERQADQSILGKMKVLSSAEGIAKIKAYPHGIEDRYCILPFAGDKTDFRENAWPDTIRWYAAKQCYYFFKPLPSWEIILRSTMKTVFGFRNELISKTYSEVGGILYLPFRKCKSDIAFEDYCRNHFIKSTITSDKDSIISIQIKPLKLPEGVKYARLVNIENQTINDDLSLGKPMIIRTAHIVFYWTDQKGKGYAASIYESERGLPFELHSMSELESRILWSWQSFRLGEN